MHSKVSSLSLKYQAPSELPGEAPADERKAHEKAFRDRVAQAHDVIKKGGSIHSLSEALRYIGVDVVLEPSTGSPSFVAREPVKEAPKEEPPAV